MSIGEIVTLIVAGAGVLSALSVFYGMFVTPIKRTIQMGENNARRIEELRAEIGQIQIKRAEDIAISGDVKSLMLESLMAILEAFEHTQTGNEQISKVKNKLVLFLAQAR